jgi:hypothetical protein
MLQKVEFHLLAVVAPLGAEIGDFRLGLRFFVTIIQSIYKMLDVR